MCIILLYYANIVILLFFQIQKYSNDHKREIKVLSHINLRFYKYINSKKLTKINS